MLQHDVNVLRSFVRTMVTEVAIAPEIAAARGLALLVADTTYVLCVPRMVLDAVSEIDVEYFSPGTTANDVVASGAIVGAISLTARTGFDARAVGSVVARAGFGPLLYDIVLSQGWIMADRNEVSIAAQRVWRRYYERADVDVRQIPDERLWYAADKPWLNWMYKLKVPVDDSALRIEGDRLIRALHERGLTRSGVTRLISALEDRAFTMQSQVRT
jgi:hypothetical protein